ncbi:DNA cytosine methyltransferase [Desulfonema magnum]|uniref:DNA (cytosine-5-)-methyltransferase n=1 Tax=Desulfonema magnum TaxID=45655 RepID=A0A975BXA0_9BACT|nr:DNA cytosine methyltransferase [Desulfonema magnum]QTA93413.1 Cytosine-specific DNA methylase domain-containing protein [Desulfonema magnum]
MKLKFLDLFAGAGGLSEGFVRAGFCPVAHVEADQAACFTLRTRMAYHWLKSEGRAEQYNDYLYRKISRSELYSLVPDRPINSVINAEISKDSLPEIFIKTDELLDGDKLDLIIGGPPCQAYSIVGRSRDKNRMRGDSRNYLYVYYAEFLKHYRPSFFVFENVTGLLSAKDEDVIFISTI